MGLFDGLLGGIVGAGMVSVVRGIIDKHGGLQGVVSEIRSPRALRRGEHEAGFTTNWLGGHPSRCITSGEELIVPSDLVILRAIHDRYTISVWPITPRSLTERRRSLIPIDCVKLDGGGPHGSNSCGRTGMCCRRGLLHRRSVDTYRVDAREPRSAP